MTTIINSVTVKDPIQPTTARHRRIQNLKFALDGTVQSDTISTSTLDVWDMEWRNLQASEYANIITALTSGAVFSFQPPMLSSPVNAISDIDSVQTTYSTPDNGTTILYDVKATIYQTY